MRMPHLLVCVDLCTLLLCSSGVAKWSLPQGHYIQVNEKSRQEIMNIAFFLVTLETSRTLLHISPLVLFTRLHLL